MWFRTKKKRFRTKRRAEAYATKVNKTRVAYVRYVRRNKIFKYVVTIGRKRKSWEKPRMRRWR